MQKPADGPSAQDIPLDRARLQLAAIVESSNDAIISKDLNGIITSWNKAAARLFSYTEDEIVGRSILTLIPRSLHHEEVEIIAKLAAGQRIEHFETIRVKKNGECLNVSITISPIKGPSGKVIGASKILRDISDRKRMEQSLLQAEKLAATGRMAASIAHEINNPLEGLLNLIYLAKKSDDLSEARSLLEAAEGELVRVAHIARQTLGYYRDDIAPAWISLSDLVRDMLRIYNPRLASCNIRLRTALAPTPPVHVKRGEILQVLSNLTANAIQAMPSGGELTLSLRMAPGSDPGRVVLDIRDTGVGIEPENLKRIFEPFFTTRGSIGTGIGLWVAHRFIESYGGRIDVVTDTGPTSHGTTMSITLPCEPSPAAAP